MKLIKNENGYIEDVIFGVGILLFLLVMAVMLLFIFVRWEYSSDNVSGIVYNTTNNNVISGNTNFSVRASVDTYVNEDNRSSYCLPPNSPYKDLVNRAAADKNIKVQVTTKTGFWFKAPWTCIDNVTVTEIK